jgi:tape measure domain
MAQYTENNITYTVSIEMKELLENSKRVQQELNELSNNGVKASKGIDKLESSAKSAGNSLGKLATIAKAVSAALVSSTVIAYAQSWNELEDRIQNTGATASQTKDILDQLLVTSDRNGRKIEESAELYIRLSNSMKELGYSTQGTLSYIDTLSNLMTINKTNSLSAESATNALTKAQMKGKLAGIEAMTVFNAMPSILKTLGKQLNKTETEVRQMASEGKLSMEKFTEAMINAQEETAALADNMRNTVTDGLNRVTNNLKKYFGELNNSTGATKLLVDSLIVMSQHVDVLVTGIGALAAIYAGKYITSLANATKKSAEKVIENIRLATSERNLAKEELRTIEIEGKALTSRRNQLIALKEVTTSKIQLAAIEKQLNNIEKERTLLVDKETAAQARLASATKLSTFAANGLKGAMSLLGGPAGILLIAAGALMTWSSKIDEAKQKSLELGDKIDELREKYKSLNDEQKQLELSRLNVQIDETTDSIKLQSFVVNRLKDDYEQYKRRAEGFFSSMFTSQEELNKREKKYRESKNDLIILETNLAKAIKARSDIESGAIEKTNEASEASEKLAKNWDKASKDNIDKKVANLSKELDIATLKAKDNSEAAFILDGLYSALGDSANEYRQDLMLLAQGQDKFTKLTNEQVEALQPLIEQLRSLSVENNKIKTNQKSSKGTTKSYTEEVKELSDKLEVAKLEAKGMTVEAELLSITQKMGGKVTAEQTARLKELIEVSQAYKELGALKSPIEVEEDSYKKSKKSLDILFKKEEIKTQEEYNAKLEQLEQQHQINMAKIKSEAVVSKADDAVAQVDPVQALANENARKLALIQEFENQKLLTEENAIALREAASRQYEQNRINAQWEIWRNQSDANELLASSLEGLASSGVSTISGLLSGTMSLTKAAQNFANVILNEAIGSLAQMGMQYVKNSIVAQTTSATTAATQAAEAVALAAAYQPAAMYASIATQGAAATIGSASYLTAIGTMKAASIAGARKNGGPTYAGSMYRVGEDNKPEILMQGGKQYLIPGENGRVLSNRQITSGRGGGSVINLNISAPVNIGDSGMSEQDGQNVGRSVNKALELWVRNEKRPGGVLYGR